METTMVLTHSSEYYHRYQEEPHVHENLFNVIYIRKEAIDKAPRRIKVTIEDISSRAR